MPHVVIHVVLLARERLLAYVATMRGLTGMFADVILHVFLARERLGTVLTPATDLDGVGEAVITIDGKHIWGLGSRALANLALTHRSSNARFHQNI